MRIHGPAAAPPPVEGRRGRCVVMRETWHARNLAHPRTSRANTWRVARPALPLGLSRSTDGGFPMKYMPLEDIKLEAKVSPVLRETPRTRRRRRLERLATLLERHHGTVNLLSGIEYTTYSARLRLRADDSPLALAYSDPLLRQEGLDGDTLGDA